MYGLTCFYCHAPEDVPQGAETYKAMYCYTGWLVNPTINHTAVSSVFALVSVKLCGQFTVSLIPFECLEGWVLWHSCATPLHDTCYFIGAYSLDIFDTLIVELQNFNTQQSLSAPKTLFVNTRQPFVQIFSPFVNVSMAHLIIVIFFANINSVNK